MAKIYVSEPIPYDVSQFEAEPQRIDLEFKRIEHGGASYEARVFIDNKRASEKTPRTHKSYAGSFFVFGHGGCFGGLGHCDVKDGVNQYDRRPGHPLTPAFKRLNVTDAVRKAMKNGKKAAKGKKSLTVTVVPVVTAATDKCDTENVLKFGKLTLITYD